MRLETEPFIEAGPSLIYRLKDLFRAIAKLVNLTADTTATHTTQIASNTALIAAAAPTAALQWFALSAAPTGWLKCNGAAVSRTTYAALFAAVGTSYGVGDGSTTFNLPELRGEFLRAWDDSRGIDSGRTLGSSQGSQNLSHTHGPSAGGVFVGAPGSPANLAFPAAGASMGATGIAADGGSEARPRNVAFLVCIKT